MTEVNHDGSFAPVVAGSALGAGAPPSVTPKNVAHRGGDPNPAVDALRQQFGAAVRRVDVVWGETTVIVEPGRVPDAIRGSRCCSKTPAGIPTRSPGRG